jgi:hypothetical protein
MKGLFDFEIPEPPRRDKRGRLPTKKRGHFAAPGTGPHGETCGSCAHLVRIQLASKSVFKCERARTIWTHGPGSDIRSKDAACGGWKPVEAHAATVPLSLAAT